MTSPTDKAAVEILPEIGSEVLARGVVKEHHASGPYVVVAFPHTDAWVHGDALSAIPPAPPSREETDENLHDAAVAFHLAYEASPFDEPLGAILDGLRAALPLLAPSREEIAETLRMVTHQNTGLTLHDLVRDGIYSRGVSNGIVPALDLIDKAADAVLSLFAGGGEMGSGWSEDAPSRVSEHVREPAGREGSR